MSRIRSVLTDTLLLACFGCALIWPLFRLEYLDNWSSIESTFIADARMLGDHLPHTGWQPLWYAGTRFDYVYPPALRYGTALISKLLQVSTARGYHLYTAFFYVFGLLGVYWLVRAGSRSRASALLSSVATALLSPSFLLMPSIARDSGFRVPQRLHVLMAYGEGPHITALCVLGAALAVSFIALRKWRPAAFAGASLLCALTVANNFYGATSLAIFFPLLVWAIWNGERDRYVLVRAAGIAVLAYGLSAFWLTPSYVWLTLTDLKWVAQPGNLWSDVLAILYVVIFCGTSWVLASAKPERAWSVFVFGSAGALSLNVLGSYYFGFRVTGDTGRLIPELDLALILAFFEGLRLFGLGDRWASSDSGGAFGIRRIAVVLLIAAAFYPSIKYLKHAWSPFPPVRNLQDQYEYRIAKWVHDSLPEERVLPSGSVRFWFDAWFDNPQIDGGSMQGMLNQNIPPATYQIIKGDGAELSVVWLQALGTDAIVVPGKNSLDAYRDYQHPEKFRGVLPVLFDDGRDTVIYRVPRVHPGIGRIVNTQAIRAASVVRGGDDLESLKKYVAVVEDPRQPAVRVIWPEFDRAELETRVEDGQCILLQETYDPSWQASIDGKPLSIHREPVLGFMLIDVPPGERRITLRFTRPLENSLGLGALLISLILVGWLMLAGIKKRPLLTQQS